MIVNPDKYIDFLGLSIPELYFYIVIAAFPLVLFFFLINNSRPLFLWLWAKKNGLKYTRKILLPDGGIHNNIIEGMYSGHQLLILDKTEKIQFSQADKQLVSFSLKLYYLFSMLSGRVGSVGGSASNQYARYTEIYLDNKLLYSSKSAILSDRFVNIIDIIRILKKHSNNTKIIPIFLVLKVISIILLIIFCGVFISTWYLN